LDIFPDLNTPRTVLPRLMLTRSRQRFVLFLLMFQFLRKNPDRTFDIYGLVGGLCEDMKTAFSGGQTPGGGNPLDRDPTWLQPGIQGPYHT